VLLPLLAAGDLGIGVWLLWHARRHHRWDRPGVPVTGVLLPQRLLRKRLLSAGSVSHQGGVSVPRPLRCRRAVQATSHDPLSLEHRVHLGSLAGIRV